MTARLQWFVLTLGAIFAIGLLLPAPPAHAAVSDRSITSIIFTPDNTFDNDTWTTTSDSGFWVQLNLSGGAAIANDPDVEGGYLLEVYDAEGKLVRRLLSAEISSNPTAVARFTGQGENGVNDTLPYGAYTLRAYSSMRNPSYITRISGSGVTILRPGDMHVSANGVLTWVNTLQRLGFCQVSLLDPNTQAPSFIRLVDFPTGFGLTNTDAAFGVTVNSNNEVFVTDNWPNGVAGTRIAKYSTATETWVNLNWITQATTTSTEDEYYGLSCDRFDSIYLATATTLVTGVGNGGTWEALIRFRDTGPLGAQVNTIADQDVDFYDIAVRPSAGDTVYAVHSANLTNARVWRSGPNLAAGATLGFITLPVAGSTYKSIWATSNGNVYVSNFTNNAFYKYRDTNAAFASLRYTISEPRLAGASGIAVWEKASTGETFVIVASQTLNQIHIYRENAAGDSAVFVRSIEDDVYNLTTSEGIAVDKDSAIFVVSRGSRSVKKFTMDGVFVNLPDAANGKFIQGIDNTPTLTDSSGFNEPRAICVDETGNIYVFDHRGIVNSSPYYIKIKKFSPSGVPLGIFDVSYGGAGGFWSHNFNQPVVQAVYGAGAIYALTNENRMRVLRINPNTGEILSFIGSAGTTANFGAVAASPPAAQDVIAAQIAPYFRRATGVYYPAALHLIQRGGVTTLNAEVYLTNLSAKISPAPITPQVSVGTINISANLTAPWLVDDFGEPYYIDNSVTVGNYRFRKWNAGSATAVSSLASDYMANSMMEYMIGQGGGVTQLNNPREAAWTDGIGRYKFNPTTNLYEARFWLNDADNNRLVQYAMAWQSVVEAPFVIARIQDTPLVVSATLSGETVIQHEGRFFVGVTTCSMQINFSKAMVNPAAGIDTLTVQFLPPGPLGFQTVTRNSYVGATWRGTLSVTSAMDDGEAVIRVENAYDNDGLRRFIFLNPSQTNDDANDDFKHHRQEPADLFARIAPVRGRRDLADHVRGRRFHPERGDRA